MVWREGCDGHREAGPRLRLKKGIIETLYTQPPTGSAVICLDLDQMGPVSAKSYPGQQLVSTLSMEWKELKGKEVNRQGELSKRLTTGGEAARQGLHLWSLPTSQRCSGAALTGAYDRRTSSNWVDFLEQVEHWIPPEVEGVGVKGICYCGQLEHAS